MSDNQQIKILDVKIDALDKPAVLERIKGFLDSSRGQHIATVNPEFVMQALKDEKFKNILNDCELSLADGIGILWATKFLKMSHGKNFVAKIFNLKYTGLSLLFRPSFCRSVVPERISGADLMVDMCRLAARRGERVFLLGNYAGSADKAAVKLRNSIPGIEIKTLAGPWIEKNGSYNQDENIQVLSEINEYQPRILFVAFNHPKAQYWIDDNLIKISSVRIAMGVGGAFDFISGKAKRAPKLFRQLGMEWLWRLFREPRRFPRIFTATIKYILQVYRAA